MSAPSPPSLVQALVSLTEDSLFAITATGKLDFDVLQALARRRQQGRTAGAGTAQPLAGAAAEGIASWDDWLVSLSAAIAPIAPPRWLPMADVVEALSLERGARGVRSFFTTKPSEREVARVRALGSLAVRVLAAVLAAPGAFTADARLLRRALIASLGLPPEDEQQLDREAPMQAEALDIQGGHEPKIARGIVRGAFFAAMGDGVDPREEQAVLAVARKAGLTTEEVNALRADARRHLDATKDFGLASVDAIRYVLADDPAEGDPLAIAAARLTLPVVHRHEAVAAINLASAVTLGQKHDVDRRQRSAVLAIAWVAALRSDPTTTRRAELAARHDRFAADLGSDTDGPSTRTEVERFLESELAALLEADAPA